MAVKNFGEFGELQQFTKFFANFHHFHNIPYANELQFAKVFFCHTSNSFTAKVFYYMIPYSSTRDTPFFFNLDCKFQDSLWKFYCFPTLKNPATQEISSLLFWLTNIISWSKLGHCYAINQQAIVAVVHYISTARIIYHVLSLKISLSLSIWCDLWPSFRHINI